MIDRTVAVTIAGALVLMLAVLEMVRRRRLREEYSLLWLMTAVVVLVVASSRGILAWLANALGIFYPPSALLVVGLGFLSATTLHFSAVVSRLSEANTSLAQEIAILRWQVREMDRRLGDGQPRSSPQAESTS
jgi:hypothetical protein